jgi:hypothetical protein
MTGKVNDGDLVTVAPCEPAKLSVGAIVLVRVKSHDYFHLVKAVNGEHFLIGNNRGGINGWVEHNCIYGSPVRFRGDCAAKLPKSRHGDLAADR